jgi:hypothetical protein
MQRLLHPEELGLRRRQLRPVHVLREVAKELHPVLSLGLLHDVPLGGLGDPVLVVELHPHGGDGGLLFGRAEGSLPARRLSRVKVRTFGFLAASKMPIRFQQATYLFIYCLNQRQVRYMPCVYRTNI